MQADELRALRREMELSQQELADAIGMSRKAIGEMEAEKAPIEKRTALAVRQVFNETMPLYGVRDDVPLDSDIALADAQLIWDRTNKRVKVVGGDTPDDDSYGASYGACNSDWIHADNVGRLLRLFSRFHELTVEHGIPVKSAHEAFLVIPEYRRSVSLGTIPVAMRP